MSIAAAESRLRATRDHSVAPVSDDEEDDIIQDNLQSEVIGSYYDGVNERKRRASVEMEESFANELEMFRRQDAALAVQCGWRCYKARETLALKRAWAEVAVAGRFLGHLMLHYIRMKEHRTEFLLHRARIAAALVVQRHARGHLARMEFNVRMAAKRAREHEAHRQRLHAEAAQAVHTLNHHYEMVDIEKIEVSNDSGAAADNDGPWHHRQGLPVRDLEPEAEIEDIRPPSEPVSPADDESPKLKPTPPAAVTKRRRKGGRPAGLCTGRARQRAGSVEATKAFEGISEAQRTALVIRPNSFREAGKKIQSMIKVSNIFASAPVQSGGPGADAGAKVEAGTVQVGLTRRAKPPKKGRKARSSKSGSARSYANAKPRYLQHLEPKPPRPADNPALAKSARRPGSNREKLPPLGTLPRETGEVRPPASGRLAHTARGQHQQLSPLHVRAR